MFFNYSKKANSGFRTYSNMFLDHFFGTSKNSPNMDLSTPLLLPKHFKQNKKMMGASSKNIILTYINLSKLKQSNMLEMSVMDCCENYVAFRFGFVHILVGPTQLVCPSVLSKNGKRRWWNLYKSCIIVDNPKT